MDTPVRLPLAPPADHVTLRVPDEWRYGKCADLQRDFPEWLGSARQTLDTAIDHTLHALHAGVAPTPTFRFILNAYFRVPPTAPPDDWRLAVGHILARLNQTRVGLSQPFEARDLWLVRGFQNVHLTCQGCINRKHWLDSKISGLVFEPAGELLRRKRFERRVGGATLATFRPKANPIFLHFDVMWAKARGGLRKYPVHALIHEATHKFAHAADEAYFPEGGLVGQCISLVAANRPTHPHADEGELFRTTWAAVGGRDDRIKAAAKVDGKKLLSNADSLAWYAMDVAALGGGAAVAGPAPPPGRAGGRV